MDTRLPVENQFMTNATGSGRQAVASGVV